MDGHVSSDRADHRTKNSYIVIESDSRTCIDFVTKCHGRWKTSGWRRDDGPQIANAETIEPLSKLIDLRCVAYRKVKDHSEDERNDRADALAIRGMDTQAAKLMVRFSIRQSFNPAERVYAIEGFHLSSLWNAEDIWGRIPEEASPQLGQPEDYEISYDRRKSEMPWINGQVYEIVSRHSEPATGIQSRTSAE
jgi:hypothetical protein